MKMNIHLVAGARPNFVKAAPLLRVLEKYRKFDVKFINTGQTCVAPDYVLVDESISDDFIRQIKGSVFLYFSPVITEVILMHYSSRGLSLFPAK